MIDLRKSIVNTQRKFGAASHYHPCIVIDEAGQRHAALFTDDAVRDARVRARLQPEDAPDVRRWWQRVVDWLFDGVSR
ncbi:MAG: hypothetical protein K8F33_08995 [Thermomonas sp.]|uniref:hypothetical protein n=1 Tax=Thermomonas sp. TaxID=1971895 RepID=UPI001D3028B4|nr:hypothetical protein [Thermomonas sp.]MBZ0088218.1 hypothetical protein [Thermomonas sp.]